MTFLSPLGTTTSNLLTAHNITHVSFSTMDGMSSDTPPSSQEPLNFPYNESNMNPLPALTDTTSEDSIGSPREPLRFSFTGHTIWLEIEEHQGDFTDAIRQSAKELGVQPIPRTHVTAIYGMDHLPESEYREKFNEVKERMTRWPLLTPIGIVTDVELCGVDGGLMDMVWSEVSFKTSVEHERHLDDLREIFKIKEKRSPWKPHASLTYDNPENSPLSLSYTANLVAEIPSLLARPRKVVGMSLWETYGKMSEWKCLDQFTFEQ